MHKNRTIILVHFINRHSLKYEYNNKYKETTKQSFERRTKIMISSEKLNTLRSAIVMINRALKVIHVEAIITIDKEDVTIYHTYANNNCIDIEKPSYTFPISMLL